MKNTNPTVTKNTPALPPTPPPTFTIEVSEEAASALFGVCGAAGTVARAIGYDYETVQGNLSRLYYALKSAGVKEL